MLQATVEYTLLLVPRLLRTMVNIAQQCLDEFEAQADAQHIASTLGNHRYGVYSRRSIVVVLGATL